MPIDRGFYKQSGEYGNSGKDYVFSSPDALWPFGYGLSYTTFLYESMQLSSDSLSFNDVLKVKVNIKNTGVREGKEVVQIYIRDEYCSVARPLKELKAFKKVNIGAGNTKQVEFEINLKDCGYYNNKGKYLLEPGYFNIMAGSSSSDIYFNKVIYINLGRA